MNVKTRIRDYFVKVITESVDDNDDIFDKGLVDSMFALQLLLFIESEFKIVAEREDLNILNFNSISSLTAFVEAKLAIVPASVSGHERQAN